MIENHIREYLLPRAFNAAVRAGAEIMRVYAERDDYDIELKNDNTPLTIADRLARVLQSRSIPFSPDSRNGRVCRADA